MAPEPEKAPDEPLATDGEQTSAAKADSRYVQVEVRHLSLALIPIALLIGLAGGYLIWGQDVSPAPGGTRQVGRIDVDPGDDPSIGPIDAPITIVEFSDFNCPHCQRWHNEVSQSLFDTFPDQIRFVYKDFPVVGGGGPGFLAAQAAHCSEEQGAYWEYHHALFSGSYVLESSGVDQAAEDLGLDLESFKECMSSARYADEVREDFEYGASLGISSTPTFFINGIPLIGAQPLLSFIEVINGELGI